MTKNERIEKRSVDIYSNMMNVGEFDARIDIKTRTASRRVAYAISLARKLIRLEDKVKKQAKDVETLDKFLNQSL